MPETVTVQVVYSKEQYKKIKEQSFKKGLKLSPFIRMLTLKVLEKQMKRTILICPQCKERVYFFKNTPTPTTVVTADSLEPYCFWISLLNSFVPRFINKPKNGDIADCPYCGAMLVFKADYVIKDGVPNVRNRNS